MDIIFLSTVCVAITTVVTFLFNVYKTIRTLETKIISWEENLNKNTLYIMKLALFSEGLPVSDRIQAGQNYLAIKHDYIVEKKCEN